MKSLKTFLEIIQSSFFYIVTATLNTSTLVFTKCLNFSGNKCFWLAAQLTSLDVPLFRSQHFFFVHPKK